jgi:hypothetical protein
MSKHFCHLLFDMTQRHRGDEDSHKQEDSHQEDSHRWASGLRRMVHYIVG